MALTRRGLLASPSLGALATACAHQGGHIESKLGTLSEQMQHVLSCEHGGINEMFAELYARTSDPRWLAMAVKLYHRAILDPLTQQRDELGIQSCQYAGLGRHSR